AAGIIIVIEDGYKARAGIHQLRYPGQFARTAKDVTVSARNGDQCGSYVVVDRHGSVGGAITKENVVPVLEECGRTGQSKILFHVIPAAIRIGAGPNQVARR